MPKLRFSMEYDQTRGRGSNIMEVETPEDDIRYGCRTICVNPIDGDPQFGCGGCNVSIQWPGIWAIDGWVDSTDTWWPIAVTDVLHSGWKFNGEHNGINPDEVRSNALVPNQAGGGVDPCEYVGGTEQTWLAKTRFGGGFPNPVPPGPETTYELHASRSINAITITGYGPGPFGGDIPAGYGVHSGRDIEGNDPGGQPYRFNHVSFIGPYQFTDGGGDPWFFRIGWVGYTFRLTFVSGEARLTLGTVGHGFMGTATKGAPVDQHDGYIFSISGGFGSPSAPPAPSPAPPSSINHEWRGPYICEDIHLKKPIEVNLFAAPAGGDTLWPQTLWLRQGGGSLF